MPRYEVRADLAEVEATLREALTPQELATLRIEAAPKAANNPFAPGARRGEPVSTTVLVWIAGAAESFQDFAQRPAVGILSQHQFGRKRAGNRQGTLLNALVYRPLPVPVRSARVVFERRSEGP